MHLIGAAGVGRLTITVDGEIVADGLTATPADPVQAMTKPGQVRADVELKAGQQIRLTVEFRPAADGDGPLAIRFGIVPAAGFDRTTLALPGRQDELVSRVAAVTAHPRPCRLIWLAPSSRLLQYIDSRYITRV